MACPLSAFCVEFHAPEENLSQWTLPWSMKFMQLLLASILQRKVCNFLLKHETALVYNFFPSKHRIGRPDTMSFRVL